MIVSLLKKDVCKVLETSTWLSKKTFEIQSSSFIPSLASFYGSEVAIFLMIRWGSIF